jgi:cytochrome P450
MFCALADFIVTAARTVMNKPYQFDDGLVLPVGTRIAFPIGAIQTDPDNFDHADKFDGRRFLPLLNQEKAKDEPSNVISAATMSTTNLAYGYGKHSCVGRFYTVRKVKLIVAKMLLEYDLKWAHEVTERPKRFAIMGQFAPNLEERILVLKRHR